MKKQNASKRIQYLPIPRRASTILAIKEINKSCQDYKVRIIELPIKTQTHKIWKCLVSAEQKENLNCPNKMLSTEQ